MVETVNWKFGAQQTSSGFLFLLYSQFTVVLTESCHNKSAALCYLVILLLLLAVRIFIGIPVKTHLLWACFLLHSSTIWLLLFD